MLDFLAPGFLWLGGVAALVPLLLHLIAQRPPERLALPTTRFLAPDPRLAVRIRRRPADLLLMALRSALLLLLAMAAARPFWTPKPAGRVDLVLLDRSVPGWRPAVDSARALLLRADGSARGELVLFDTTFIRVTPNAISGELFDSLSAAGPAAAGPASIPAEYAAALRALREIAGERGQSDSARVTLITAPRWGGWSAGLARLRPAAWEHRVRVVAMPVSDSAAAPASPTALDRRRASVVAAPSAGEYVTAGLAALGWSVTRGAPGEGAAGELRVLLAAAPPASFLDRPAGGPGVVIVAGAAAAEGWGSALPWELGARAGGVALEEAGRAPGALVLDDGTTLHGAAERAPGAPRPGSMMIAAWADGRPAAVAARAGDACVVFVATGLEEGSLPLSPRFPALLHRLTTACDPAVPPGSVDTPLDRGALAVLAGSRHPSSERLEPPRHDSTRRPLDRWLLLAALGVALVETGIAYGVRRL